MQISDNQLLTGFALKRNQILAMLMKKSLSTIRSWILFLIQIIIPVVFLIIAIVVTRNTDTSRDLPEIDLTLDAYDNPITVVTGDTHYKNQMISILNQSNNLYTDLGTADFSSFIFQKVNISFPQFCYFKNLCIF